MISHIFTNSDTIRKSHLSPVEKSFKSNPMRNALRTILNLAKLDMPVIVIGEIGSGKKRMAQIIHENGSRAAHPFHSFYCLDLTNEEYEEAFREQLHIHDNHFILKYNIIEKASRGTLYLNQFSELRLDLMLNIVQSFKKSSEQLFRYNEKARPRLILSVNMETYASLKNIPGWRTVMDLLNPHTVIIPPLRERKEDIPLLIDFFIETIKLKSKKFLDLSISDAALHACSSYNWPGNIIQLNNALLQGAVLSHGKTIENHHLPFSMNWKLPYKFEGSDI
jgi:DNA-binding NtrC family response regulator